MASKNIVRVATIIAYLPLTIFLQGFENTPRQGGCRCSFFGTRRTHGCRRLPRTMLQALPWYHERSHPHSLGHRAGRPQRRRAASASGLRGAAPLAAARARSARGPARPSRRRPWSTRPTCDWSTTTSQALEQPRPLLRRGGRGHAADPRRERPAQAAAQAWRRAPSGRSGRSGPRPRGPDEELLAVDEALERLAAADAQAAELVKLHYFAGLTIEQAAEVARGLGPQRLSDLGLRPSLAVPLPGR